MRATRSTYAGLFCVTLATLMYELLLTRIFSVTMWYHFAFMAISIAVFGMTVGAIIVYLKPQRFEPADAQQRLSQSAMWFAASVPVTFFLQLQIHFIPMLHWVGMLTLAPIYALTALAFVASGVCVCIALTKIPDQVGQLYAADLIGAAAGCLLLPFALNVFGGTTSVIIVALLAALGAVFFAIGNKKQMTAALVTTAVIAVLVPVNMQTNFLRLVWVKGEEERNVLYEKWNSFSRLRVVEERDDRPLGWGVSRAMPKEFKKTKQLKLDIDSNAATFLTASDGNAAKLGGLSYDVSSSVHYLRPKSKVAVIGVGGGVDILASLLFSQPQIVGLELNNDTLNILTNRFGDYTGHIDRNKAVTLVNDEARSWLSRCPDQFDIIQISLIDTWAATSAGAFVLSENSLYTVEAWKTFINHLTPRGVLSCSRWYYRDRQDEIYRLVALARTALIQSGITDESRNHMILITNMMPDEKGNLPDAGVGNLMVSRTAFTDEDIKLADFLAKHKEFRIVLSPHECADPTLARLFDKDADRFIADYPLNIAAPTDDSPFFFQMARISTWVPGMLGAKTPWQYHNSIAIMSLSILLATVTVLTLLCIIIPLKLTSKGFNLKAASPYLVYFCAIGFGYMFIEISQMQRLSVFLGHPSYGLFVVLFTLLLSSGLGSYFTGKIQKELPVLVDLWLKAIVAALLVFAVCTPLLVNLFAGASTPLRIAVAIVTLAPLGFVMGGAFPLGMRLSTPNFSKLTPWFWGLNGATSVCASVLAIIVAIGFGITTVYLCGVVTYVVAWLCTTLGKQKTQPDVGHDVEGGDNQ